MENQKARQQRAPRIGAGAIAATVGLVACIASCASERGGLPKESVGQSSAASVTTHSVQVGTRCQQDYQNGWMDDVGSNDVWNRCSNFQSTMGTFELNAFYYSLHNGKVAMENADTCGWACGYADSVDFLYINTHGGTNAVTSFWGMWDRQSYARTMNMRLGNTGRENMVFTAFSCDTHVGDNNTWNRWFSTFAGGMVLTNGAHGFLYTGNDQSATEYATRMRDGEPIARAWLESTYYADTSNHPTAIATGTSSVDCWNRMGTTLDTLFSTPILRDSNISYMCWWYWN